MSTSNKNNAQYTYAWIAASALCILCFVFFQWLYPYHLHFREQIMIFIPSVDQLYQNFPRLGWVGDIVSDFLTQFFYYRIAGPVIMTSVMMLVWVGAWLTLRKLGVKIWISIVIASIVMVWQLLCQTHFYADLSTSIALAVTLIAFGMVWPRKLLAVVCLVISVYLFGNPFKGSLIAWPDWKLERKMAFDSEAYFGGWQKILEMAEDNTDSRTEIYYYNLANALSGQLPDKLLKHKQYGMEGLIPTIGPGVDFMTVNAVGELWYPMASLANAEHCTMLGLVFSPNSTGSRYLKRLAEINIANGDNEAAMKYLRMLQQSIIHRGWASSRISALQSQSVDEKINGISSMRPTTDLLHYDNESVKSLKHLIAADTVKRNNLAYDYLLCAHLLNKNLDGFVEDFDPDRHRSRLYDEALLMCLLLTQATPEQAMSYDINPQVLSAYKAYDALYRASGGDPEALAAEYGDTYWYYYEFIQ